MTPRPALLTLAGLWKSYAAPVLADVSLDLRQGEVHALVGENGAGKTTLARILAGLTKPDAGNMTLCGRPYAPRNKPDAERLGVRLVLQELHLIGNLTVAESIFFGHLPHRLGWIDRGRLNAAASGILEKVGLGHLDPRRLVRTLGVGQQQLVEIAVGLSQRCEVLILDEPTAALSDPEVDRLFEQVRQLQAEGTGIIYISHRLEEIQRIADRVSVLRDGQLVANRAVSDFSLDEIVRLMVGRELGPATRRERKPEAPAPVALRVLGLRRGAMVNDVSFEARRGEILGFAGLMGSGRTETMRALFGADRREAGQIFLDADTRPARINSPRDAVHHGIAFLTENRKEEGLFLPSSVRSNVTLLCLRQLSRLGGWVRRALEGAESERWVRRLFIRCQSVEQPVLQLSGGNQQKVVMARWLARDCDILIFDEPTRGIDIGAKFEIYEWLERLTGQGKTVLMVSSDLPELLALCDRIAVMSAGRVAAIFQRGEWTQDQIMAAALSGYRRGNIE